MKKFALVACCMLWSVTCWAQTAMRPDQISPATPDITWGQNGTGTGYQIGTIIPWRTDSATPPVFSPTDNARIVEVTGCAAGCATATLPDATGSSGAYPTGFAFKIQVKTGTLTLNRASASLINGKTAIKVGAYQNVSLVARGTNWYAWLGAPQPAAQTGASKLSDSMAWQ
jgi:hypothetical protein